MAFLPDGSALVTEKAGHLKWWRAGKANAEVAGVPAVKPGGQAGLLDVALSPGFARDRLIYLTYSEPSAVGGSGLAMARGARGGRRAVDRGVRAVERRQGWAISCGDCLCPDGHSLFLSPGERQRLTPAQDANQPRGKILHPTLNGQPAAGNPWSNKVGAATTTITSPPENTGAARSAVGQAFTSPGANRTPFETWSTGHRNPYGLAFDAAGRLRESENGPMGGDEINLIKPGRNFGWPYASNGSNYDGIDIPDHKPGDGYGSPRLW